jgi:hypothetical protein
LIKQKQKQKQKQKTLQKINKPFAAHAGFAPNRPGLPQAPPRVKSQPSH